MAAFPWVRAPEQLRGVWEAVGQSELGRLESRMRTMLIVHSYEVSMWWWRDR